MKTAPQATDNQISAKVRSAKQKAGKSPGTEAIGGAFAPEQTPPIKTQGSQEAIVAEKPIQSTLSYFQQRMQELGIDDRTNTITVVYDCYDDPIPRHVSIFSEEHTGDIGILYVGIAGLKTYQKGRKELPYIRLRLHPDRIRLGIKYITPRGAGTQVFIPPQVLRAFEESRVIKTLVITEGEFKAFKLAMHGLPALGLQGIGNSREKDQAGNSILNTEIERIIEVCQVRTVILLFDNDCLKVEYDAEKDVDKDLAKRSFSFFSAVKNFREAMKPMNCDVHFSHLKPDLRTKGIDDLLNSQRGNELPIINDLLTLKQNSDYFQAQNITIDSLSMLKAYFHIGSAQLFYDKYGEGIGENRFRFLGAYYQWNGKKVEELVSDEINNYVRIGDDYYEKLIKPDKMERLLPWLDKRRKSTIVDDYGAKALKYIPKRKGFCLVPSHVNYREVIHGFYNAYHRLTHEPRPGPIDNSLAMVMHIFGETHYEFGLDYLQLLYTKPSQLLPILLLQSKARNTGKSTFSQWIIEIFGANAVKLSNADLENDFNSTYVEKLVVVVDETSLSKKVTSEAIKKMSTEQGKVWVNAKGRQQYETDWIGKFIFCTNTEDTSLFIGKGETRYFVRTVGKLTQDDPDMNLNLLDEIPSFLDFLSTRQLHYPRKGRMYFDSSIYKTSELTGAIDANLSITERAIRQVVSDTFAMFKDEMELFFTASDLQDECKKISKLIDGSGITSCLKSEFGFGHPKQTRYDYFSLQIAHCTPNPAEAKLARNGRAYCFPRAKYFVPASGEDNQE